MNGEPEIKEWHMHLYWNRDQDPQALAFRDHLIEQVKNKNNKKKERNERE